MWQEISDLKSVRVEYIRRNSGVKRGMLVAGIHPSTKEVCIGWSLCYAGDEFDKYKAFNIAEGRAWENDRMSKYANDDESIFSLLEIIPFTVLDALPGFIARMERYYHKNNVFSDVVEYLMEVLFEYYEEEDEEVEYRAVGDEADDPYYDPDFDERNEDTFPEDDDVDEESDMPSIPDEDFNKPLADVGKGGAE